MRPMRIPAVQATMSWLLAQWMRFCFATIRWRHENQHLAEQVWADGGGVICAFWHSRTALAPASWPSDRAPPISGLISRSADGQFVASAVARLGITAIRGSTAKRAGEKDKGGTAAFREMLRQLRVAACAVTPDGPRGPTRHMGEGLPLMAKMSKAPVLFLGVSCSPSLQLATWDRAMLPMPFARGAVVWDLDRFPEGAAPADLIPDWTARLNAVEARADALVGHKDAPA